MYHVVSGLLLLNNSALRAYSCCLCNPSFIYYYQLIFHNKQPLLKKRIFGHILWVIPMKWKHPNIIPPLEFDR